MRSEIGRQEFFTRRAFVLAAGKLGLLSVLAGRLYQLQVVQSQDYATLSESNRIKLLLIPPPRGRLLDRLGVAMAENKINYRVILNPDQTPRLTENLARIFELLELNSGAMEGIRKELKAGRNMLPVLVKEYLSWEEVAKLEVNAPDLPGVAIELGQVRYHPFVEMTSHILGYVGAVAEGEDERSPLHRLPDFKIGKQGIERRFDERLIGQAGIRRVEVNAHGLLVRELAREESKPGEDIPLTIDMRLQKFAAERIADQSASVVVLDAHRGDVLAMVSLPAYDTNRFSQGIRQDYWKELLNHERHPPINKSIAGQYPPGSTFKMIVALAGLEAGVVTPYDTAYCPGFMHFGSHTFRCWKKEGHGTMDMVNAISHSCDVYFYQLSHKLGPDRIAAMARRFGLGEETGIEIPGEKPGIAPTEAWKRKRYKQPWLGGETLNIGIGQGYVLSTPLQLAVMAARLASGKKIEPRIAKENLPEEAAVPSLGIKPEHLRHVIDGMIAVTKPGGTAYASRIQVPRYTMAGKTGTSQVVKINHNRPKNAFVPWNERHHAWFVAFAPEDNPHYACAVLVEHGESGSKAAAPIARDVLLKTQELDPCNRFTAPSGDTPAVTTAPATAPDAAEDAAETDVPVPHSDTVQENQVQEGRQ